MRKILYGVFTVSSSAFISDRQCLNRGNWLRVSVGSVFFKGIIEKIFLTMLQGCFQEHSMLFHRLAIMSYAPLKTMHDIFRYCVKSFLKCIFCLGIMEATIFMGSASIHEIATHTFTICYWAFVLKNSKLNHISQFSMNLPGAQEDNRPPIIYILLYICLWSLLN